MKTLTSLLERLNLDPEVLEACARNAEALGLPLERALYEAERINENQYLETAAARHAMPCELRLAALMDKEGSGWATDAERVCKVPLPWLRKQKVVPVRDKDGTFFSTKHEGKGIGLASVQAITEQYEGAMTVETGSGRFCVAVLLNKS